jgi:RNA polymerase sigma factor (TIGR02999 family)
MGTASQQRITQLLLDWGGGDLTALERLMPLVYEELRRLARRYMRNERPGHTLQTTALVNEAYLRLTGYRCVRWQERAQFFALAAQLMRRVLIEHARARDRQKRGGRLTRVLLDEAEVLSPLRSRELLALDEALVRLAEVDPRKARVVELRFFGGLDNKEIADVLGVAPNTVMRDRRMAEAWLRRELSEEP